jgi:hypothetical protein
MRSAGEIVPSCLDDLNDQRGVDRAACGKHAQNMRRIDMKVKTKIKAGLASLSLIRVGPIGGCRVAVLV